MKRSAEKVFKSHGTLCATRPCEVIFIVITLALMMISYVDWQKKSTKKDVLAEYYGLDILFMTLLRCGSLLYTFHQFQKLSQEGSKYLIGIAVLFVAFSSFLFCCTVLKLLDCNVSDLKDAFFFFLLLIDLSKAKFLAKCALRGNSYEEVQISIANGLASFGPSFTLDTISEALLIGAGTLSGVERVEQMCGYAVLSIIVNYIVLITFYPSFLSFILELSDRYSSSASPLLLNRDLNNVEYKKSNPILQGVKGIMSAGLFLIHGIKRWSVDSEAQPISVVDLEALDSRNTSSIPPMFIQWLNAGLGNAVLMIITIVFLAKYIFMDSFWSHPDKMKMASDLTHPETKQEAASQTEEEVHCEAVSSAENLPPRSLEECRLIAQKKNGYELLTDAEILILLRNKVLVQRSLEKSLQNCYRAVRIRRAFMEEKMIHSEAVSCLPFQNFNYDKVQGTCCENVVGYVPLPVGLAGPLRVNGREYMVPLATTEGALVASTSRGCKAISESEEGAISLVYKDGMTRGPVVEMPSAEKAIEVYKWIKEDTNFVRLKESFDGTSAFARLIDIHVFIAARHLYLRFEASTGDAMGMNMVGKGTEAALGFLKTIFPDLKVISISGNVCTDKKPSAINWILGRGKSVVCEATVPASVVKSVLKSSAEILVETNIKKNYLGSALAGSIGGHNAHSANIIAALFIACGQDPAQVVGSSSCLTVMERKGLKGEDLYISVTMPCIEVGTVGGGTSLPAQSACLSMLGVKGPSKTSSGDNCNRLASIAAATVMAGELSLMASLAEQSLMRSHLALNRAAPKTLSSDK